MNPLARFQRLLLYKLIEPTARRTSDSQDEDPQLHCQVCKTKLSSRERTATCSHGLFLRSYSSYHASRMRASSGRSVSTTTCSSPSRPSPTTTEETDHERKGDLSRTSWCGRDAVFSKDPVVSAGRRSPNPTSSVTWRLAGEAATSEIMASSISTSTRCIREVRPSTTSRACPPRSAARAKSSRPEHKTGCDN